MFDRPHHRLVAEVLSQLDADALAVHHCWFGGGTAITLSCGEYRESVDIDSLVSDQRSYRALRQAVKADGLSALDTGDLDLVRPARVDPRRSRRALAMHTPRAVVWQAIRDVATRCAGIEALA